MGRRVILIRHAVVPEAYQACCYGQSDVELDETGRAQSQATAEVAATWPITHLYASDLSRARDMAGRISERRGVPVTLDRRLRERHFGAWELVPWDDLAANHFAALANLAADPEKFAPEGGETTFEHRNRIMEWYRELPREGFIVAVTHGGTIAVLLGTLRGLPVYEWPELLPDYGAFVELGDTPASA